MPIERWLLAARLRFRSLFDRSRVEAELDEELAFHVEHLIETKIANGMNAADARRKALKEIEGYEQKKEECRDARGLNWLEDIARDVRYGLRMLSRSPIFTAVAILSLALGIGSNSAIFSVIDTLLLRPLPVPHPQQLQNIFLRMPERLQPYLSYPLFQSVWAHNPEFVSMAAWANHRFQLRSGGDVIHLDGQLATGSYFRTFGVSPERGRVFTEADDHTNGGKQGPVAVISDRFWERRFNRSSSAVGSGIVLDNIGFTVIGIMPPEFFGGEAGTHPDVWIPISFSDRVDMPGCLSSRSCWWLAIMGRLRFGIKPQQANAQLTATSPLILKETLPTDWKPAWKRRYLGYSFYAVPGEQGWSFLRLQFSDPLRILMTLVGLVLLVACANMANLLLARASARQREIAVRLSMGAGRARIVRQFLTESVLLSSAGGLVGTAFAFWLTRVLIAFVTATQRHGPGQFTRLELQPDWRIVLFTLGVTFLSGIVFGLAPALRSTRAGIAASLKQAGQNLRGSEGRFQAGRLILTVQAALSVLLVTSAGLFAGSLFRLLTVNFGFNPENLSLIELDTDKRPEKGAALAALYGRIVERANTIPGVETASLAAYVPLSNGGWDEVLRVPGKPNLPDNQADTDIDIVGPNFFDAMQTRLLAGRSFTGADTAASQQIGIISQTAAERFFHGQNPLGRYVLLEGKPIQVVGIAENLKYMSLRDDETPELYLPYTQHESGSFTILLRMKPGMPPPNAGFRSMLHGIAPDVPIGMVYTMEEQVDSSVGLERLMASLSVFFGTLALLLTSIGLYGVLAYTVTRRTGEIGIRVALGATRAHVIWLMLRTAMAYVLVGIVIGTIGVLAASKIVASMLYGIQPNDRINLFAAIFTLLTVAALAAFLPSLRASRIDPATALRQE